MPRSGPPPPVLSLLDSPGEVREDRPERGFASSRKLV